MLCALNRLGAYRRDGQCRACVEPREDLSLGRALGGGAKGPGRRGRRRTAVPLPGVLVNNHTTTTRYLSLLHIRNEAGNCFFILFCPCQYSVTTVSSSTTCNSKIPANVVRLEQRRLPLVAALDICGVGKKHPQHGGIEEKGCVWIIRDLIWMGRKDHPRGSYTQEPGSILIQSQGFARRHLR